MAKVFSVESELHENPNRNNFDGTHKRHMSGKFGVIYPFLCEPVVPSDTWELDTAIGVNLMPMWYPTQSNMRFMVYYFYVPNRIMYKNWKNFSEGLGEHNFPYLDAPAEFYRTGSLPDYLGIPTNYVLPTATAFQLDFNPPRQSSRVFYSDDLTTGPILSSNDSLVGCSLGELTSSVVESGFDTVKTSRNPFNILLSVSPISSLDNSPVLINHPLQAEVANKLGFCIGFFGSNKLVSDAIPDAINPSKLVYLGNVCSQVMSTSTVDELHFSDTDFVKIEGFLSQYTYVYPALIFWLADVASQDSYKWYHTPDVPTKIRFYFSAGANLEIAAFPSYCPYYHTGHTTNTVKISALPFRAYEMVYNSYFRDSHGVQPFVVNGTTKYNEYLTTDDEGADTTNYALQYRNWELDSYTSCLPSPQQGNAPIIAVDVDGTMRIAHDDGTTSTVRLRDVDGAAGVEILNSDINPEHPEDARTVMRLSSTGMTIADFRYGNALTRFLETSLRTGFRYADFIFGHFGTSPKHQELDMPIFLGGYTQMVDTSKVTNVSANPSAGVELGQFAGVGASFDAMKHKIKHFFDDFGYVLGVMCLVPDAAYSQVLPKHFTYNNRLDFFFPEFGQLGLQPVTYEEFCPIQSYAEYVNGDTSKLLTDTFGYQRPNHDLVWLPDTVHGLFRTSLQGSVIQRRFGLRPELGDEFMKVKPEECNDIFSVVETGDDTWLGQVITKITMQRPIPRVVIPSLGR